jgi:hypothetical protein
MKTSKQCIGVHHGKYLYATIILQVLSNLLTPASTRKKVPHSIFETRLLVNMHILWRLSNTEIHPQNLDQVVKKIVVSQVVIYTFLKIDLIWDLVILINKFDCIGWCGPSGKPSGKIFSGSAR